MGQEGGPIPHVPIERPLAVHATISGKESPYQVMGEVRKRRAVPFLYYVSLIQVRDDDIIIQREILLPWTTKLGIWINRAD